MVKRRTRIRPSSLNGLEKDREQRASNKKGTRGNPESLVGEEKYPWIGGLVSNGKNGQRKRERRGGIETKKKPDEVSGSVFHERARLNQELNKIREARLISQGHTKFRTGVSSMERSTRRGAYDGCTKRQKGTRGHILWELNR